MFRYLSTQEYIYLAILAIYSLLLFRDIKKKDISKLGIISSICVIGVTLTLTFCMSPAFVVGTSMNPTLQDGQVLALNKLDRNFEEYDIIVAYSPTLKKSIIKRIIATEGDTVSMSRGQVFVNNKLVEEQFSTVPTFEDMEEIVVPEGCYFVMGDNRPNSLDSRSDQVGCINKKYILGKIIGY